MSATSFMVLLVLWAINLLLITLAYEEAEW